MCAITGIFTDKDNVCLSIYNALTVLQHRGQDAAGIATCASDGSLRLHKDNGLVRDVFDEKTMISLKGQYGLGHTRYPTSGSSSNDEAQPFYVNSPFGLVLVHNGNLINTPRLRKELMESDLRHLNTSSDSELILNIYANALQKNIDLNTSDYLFDQLGNSWASGGTGNPTGQAVNYIDTIVRVTGATTGYRLDIPVRFAKVPT